MEGTIGKTRRLYGHVETVLRLRFSTVGNRALSGSRDGAICLWGLRRQPSLGRIPCCLLASPVTRAPVDGSRTLGGSRPMERDSKRPAFDPPPSNQGRRGFGWTMEGSGFGSAPVGG